MSMFNPFESGPLMGEILGIGASLLGGASSAAGGSATAMSAEAMMLAAEQIEEKTDKYRKIVRRDTKKTRRKGRRYLNQVQDINPYEDLDFNRTPNPEDFMDTANMLASNSFDFKTDQKRSNLQFSLGGADDLLRKAQIDFAKLSTGDTSAFEKNVKASAFGALAESAGFPVGAFENTSAKNLMQFRQMGVENTLGITDFFAKQGTVDPVDPIDNLFKLASFDQSENARELTLDIFNREIDFKRQLSNQGTRLSKAGLGINLETSILSILAEMEGTALATYADAYKFAAGAAGGEELGQAQTLGGIGESMAQIGQMITPTSSGGGGFLSGLFG
jgi:hypothetical protein